MKQTRIGIPPGTVCVFYAKNSPPLPSPPELFSANRWSDRSAIRRTASKKQGPST